MQQTNVQRVKSISEFHKIKGLQPPQHPLISVVHYNDVVCARPSDKENYIFDFYHISVKRGDEDRHRYGQSHYDFDNGVMFFVAPNQVFGIEHLTDLSLPRSGWLLMIHPDFFWNSSLANTMKRYDFFDYAVNEALFLSDKEESILDAIVKNIEQESHANLDKFSQQIIVSQIETLLNYSERFYQRQFITRSKNNHEVLVRLEQVLDEYFADDEQTAKGLPTVQHIADLLHLSPVYLTSLLKSLTGQSTQQLIHEKLIQKAKEQLSTTSLSVSEIAYALGFEHTQSFSKLFKTKTNLTPLAFRQSFN